MKGHVDPETLSAYREHLLRRGRARRVGAHLAECPQCAATDSGLAEVSSLLAQSPPPAMPAALASRIETAIAAEAAARATLRVPGTQTTPGALNGTHGAGGPGHGTNRTGARPARSRTPLHRPGLSLRVAATTAAVVAAIGGAGYGFSLLVGSSSSNSAAAGASPGLSKTPARGIAPAPSVFPAMSPRSGSYSLVASNTDYQPSQLTAQARSVLARFPHRENTPAGGAPLPKASAFGGPQGLQACVARVSGRDQPELVDLASYRGQPAAVVFLRAPPGTQVVVAGAGCSGSSADVLARTSLSATP